MTTVDVAIVGGGIVGLASAYAVMQRFPGRRVMVIEKESRVGFHQSGRNSGVLHSGIYYAPGSAKATTCIAGKKAMEEFCESEGIDHRRTGKVIVATSAEELPRLDTLYERGRRNGVTCRMIDRAELQKLEPHATGIRAIHVEEAGIVDYRQVCDRLSSRIQERGGEVRVGVAVAGVAESSNEVVIKTSGGDVSARVLVNCAGLHSDRVAAMTRAGSEAKIIPFRGEYYQLKESAAGLCRTLIYPVPDPAFPFLGVHLTRRISGMVDAGPNAVLAFAREGYAKTTFNARDLFETLSYPGFMRLAMRYWRTGAGEIIRSVSKGAFVRALQRLVPDLREQDLEDAPSGVRAQAVARDGRLLDDFCITQSARAINVVNAPSPAATASLGIGAAITDRLAAVL